jgi:hypothetical protein
MLLKRFLIIFQIFLIAFILKGIHFLHESRSFSQTILESKIDKNIIENNRIRLKLKQTDIEAKVNNEIFDFSRDMLVHVHIQVSQIL